MTTLESLLVGMLLGTTIGSWTLLALFIWSIADRDARDAWIARLRLWFKKPNHVEMIVRWATIVFLVGVAWSTWMVDADSTWGQLRTEASSVAVAVIVLEELSRFRNQLEFKQSIIRQLASRSNDFALEAVEIARTKNWLYDGTLIGAVLSSANLSHAHLSNANLQKTNCWGTVLWRAGLRGTNLQGAHMRSCVLYEARMFGVELQRAYLSGACPMGAELKDAKLQYTNLLGAHFKSNTEWHKDADLTGAQLRYAVYDSATTWPEGYDPAAAGAINRDELTDEKWQNLLETYAQLGVEWAVEMLRVEQKLSAMAD